jgi:hypothetical protein
LGVEEDTQQKGFLSQLIEGVDQHQQIINGAIDDNEDETDSQSLTQSNDESNQRAEKQPEEENDQDYFE